MITYNATPPLCCRIGTRCMLDGLGLFVAGTEKSVGVLVKDARDIGGTAGCAVAGRGEMKVPANLAARVLGTAGHAHDWDDTQATADPAHVYGLLTHPTIPPLARRW